MTRLITLCCIAFVLFCGIHQASAAIPYTVTDSSESNIAEPYPYGTANNVADAGWIWWDTGDYFTADMGAPATVNGVRIWSTYPGGGRGAMWEVLSSDDGNNWTSNGEFEFKTESGGGVNDAGDQRNDFGGWYDYSVKAGTAQYWKLQHNSVTAGHAPRVGEVQFVPEPSTFVIISLGLLGMISLARRSR